MTPRPLGIHRFLAPLMLMLLTAPQPAAAQIADRYWIDTGGGSFNDTGNWSTVSGGAGGASVPTSSNKATFRRAGFTYPVTYPGKVNFPLPVYEMNQLRVGSNTVNFSDELTGIQAPGTLNVTNATTAIAGRGIVIGVDDTDKTAELTTSLAHFNAVAATLGDVPDSVGTLNVNGGTFSVTGSSSTDDELIIGNQGKGSLNVSGGGHVNVTGTNGNIVVSKNPTGLSVFDFGGGIAILGAGSQLNDSGNLYVGLNGPGSIDVENGGLLTTASATINGFTGSTGYVRGAGARWNVGDDLILGAHPPSDPFGAFLNVTNGGLLSIGGAVFVQSGAVLSGNDGTIEGDVFNDGILTVRRSNIVMQPIFGVMHITGDYSQLGRLDLNIGDPTHLDRLQVDGDLNFDAASAKLNVYSNSILHGGDEFDIINWDGVLSGAFTPNGVTLPSLPAALLWDTSQLYATGVIKVVYRFAADFNEDGNVSDLDLVKWKAGFGTASAATHMQGDANGDGAVDGADYLVWQRQFGSAAVAPVPEPTTLALLIAAVLAKCRRLRAAGGCGAFQP